MVDPVSTADDHTYDRAAILLWFQHSTTSPMTGLPLSSWVLTPKPQLREEIRAWMEKHGVALSPSSLAGAAAAPEPLAADVVAAVRRSDWETAAELPWRELSAEGKAWAREALLTRELSCMFQAQACLRETTDAAALPPPTCGSCCC
jgi:hypothetical protein